MASTAEFEEKEYEQPLNQELIHDPRNKMWSPGQVFEEHFGIDAALNAGNTDFWKLFGYPHTPQGVILDHFRWGYIWKKTGVKRALPNFEINLLLQTKRSQHRIGRNASYSSHGITGSYWQFDVTDHQQKALEQLHHILANRTMVCYGAPAFHTLKALYDNISGGKLIENSTFVQAHRMTTHKRWVYDKPGMMGLACSKIEKIDEGNFEGLFSNTFDTSNDGNPLQNLLRLESAAREAISSLQDNNPLIEEFNKRYLTGDIASGSSDTNSSIALRAFVNFSIFCTLTNVSWYVRG